MSDIKTKSLYPIAELATSTELTKKLTFIKEANAAAKAYDPKIVRVSTVGFNDEVKHVAYANSDGVYWEDSQPLFMFNTFVRRRRRQAPRDRLYRRRRTYRDGVFQHSARRRTSAKKPRESRS